MSDKDDDKIETITFSSETTSTLAETLSGAKVSPSSGRYMMGGRSSPPCPKCGDAGKDLGGGKHHCDDCGIDFEDTSFPSIEALDPERDKREAAKAEEERIKKLHCGFDMKEELEKL